MDKSTISMAIFNSYVSLPEGIIFVCWTIARIHHLRILGAKIKSVVMNFLENDASQAGAPPVMWVSHS